MSPKNSPKLSYAAAGVDVDAAERLISRFAQLAHKTRRPEVLSEIGSFGGLFRLGAYRDPVLVASTDSVGTKVKLAALTGRYEGLGHDLVNHCVNDVLTAGAEPLFFLDYIGGAEVTDEAKLELVHGAADACSAAGCALLGGETADLPGLYAGGDFDFVGFVVGVVERDAVIDGSRVREGDALLALPSNGLHTNGYSLVRGVFDVGAGGDPAAELERVESSYPELDGTLADALLAPHRCYLNDLRPVLPRLRAIAHITGGGIPGNLPRVLPDGLGARVDRVAWETPALFRLIQERGNVPADEMYRTFNMGVGVIVAVAPEDAESVRSRLPEAFVVGDVVSGEGVDWA